ncbi:hypothetical protein [Mycobacteroides abscessus]|uniref:hypothetical protein n=2 Tax=Mycobacteroides abscessus TaxID=36809 RepID=UPI000C2608B0|nr:hypothetical protein [Mycobacteroides abscessus]
MVGRPFSDAERVVALDASVPAKDAAQLLGRTVGTIRAMRAKDRLSRREVPDGKHGTAYAWRTYGCRCEPCVLASRAHQRQWDRSRPLEAKVRKAAQFAVYRAARRERHSEIRKARSVKVAEITGAKAIRAQEPVTDEDIAIACDMSLTILEAALALGRTAASVAKIRHKHRNRHDPAQRPRNRPWTDEELAIALDESITVAQAAAHLGRSQGAVAAKRAINAG